MSAETSRERMMSIVNEAGVDALLLKPLNTERLRQGLKRLVDSIPERGGPWTLPYGDCVGTAMQDIIGKIGGVQLVPSEDNTTMMSGNVVITMVSIFGDIHWTISMAFDEQAAVGVSSRLAGIEIPFDSVDLGDAMGEVTNMVAGEIKRVLLNRDLSVKITLPTVLAATEIRWLVHNAENASQDSVRFSSPMGFMRIAITVGQSAQFML
jgi:chemotaxis protein CheX